MHQSSIYKYSTEFSMCVCLSLSFSLSLFLSLSLIFTFQQQARRTFNTHFAKKQAKGECGSFMEGGKGGQAITWTVQ